MNKNPFALGTKKYDLEKVNMKDSKTECLKSVVSITKRIYDIDL